MQGAAVEAADEPLRPERGQREADLRDRHQGAVADRPRQAQPGGNRAHRGMASGM